MDRNRLIKIIGAGIVGAIIGSTIGIAGMGGAVAGTLPVGALLAYLMYLWTRDKNTIAPEIEFPVTEGDVNQAPAQEQGPWRDIEQAAHDAVLVLVRFLGASWNFLMNFLVMMGVMPIFRGTPWLLAVLIVVMIVLIPPVGIFFFITGVIALDKGAAAENNFIIFL